MRDVSQGGRYIEISWHGSIIYTLADLRGNAIILMKPSPAIYHSQSRAGAERVFKDCLRDRSQGTGGVRGGGGDGTPRRFNNLPAELSSIRGWGSEGAELRRREPSALVGRQ